MASGDITAATPDGSNTWGRPGAKRAGSTTFFDEAQMERDKAMKSKVLEEQEKMREKHEKMMEENVALRESVDAYTPCIIQLESLYACSSTREQHTVELC